VTPQNRTIVLFLIISLCAARVVVRVRKARAGPFPNRVVGESG
jgi:hypothetical protein